MDFNRVRGDLADRTMDFWDTKDRSGVVDPDGLVASVSLFGELDLKALSEGGPSDEDQYNAITIIGWFQYSRLLALESHTNPDLDIVIALFTLIRKLDPCCELPDFISPEAAYIDAKNRERSTGTLYCRYAAAILQLGLEGNLPAEAAISLSSTASDILYRWKSYFEGDDYVAALNSLSIASALAAARISGKSLSEIDRSLSVLQDLISASPSSPHLHYQIGLAHQLRFDLSSEVSDLIAGIEAYHKFLELYNRDDEMRPAVKSNLSMIYASRYGMHGLRTDLEQAIRYKRDSISEIQAVGTSPRKLMKKRAELVCLLIAMYERHQVREAVVEAFDSANALVELIQQSEYTDSDIDFDVAIAIHRSSMLSNDLGHEALAVHLMRQIDKRTPLSSRVKLRMTSTLMGVLISRYQRTDQPEHLDEAIEIGRTVLERMPDYAPDYSTTIYALGRVYVFKWISSKSDADFDAAWLHLQRAAQEKSADWTTRIRASCAWAAIAGDRGRVEEASTAYALAVSLLPRFAWRGTDRRTRASRIAEWSGLASIAAATAIEAGVPQRAIELMEEGRCIMWTQFQESRSDIGLLAQANPELYGKLVQLIDSFDESDASRVLDPLRPTTDPLKANTRFRAASDWEAVIADVRTYRGLSKFLLPPNLTEMQGALSSNVTAVMVNVSNLRSDALIVNKENILALPLPDLSHSSAADTANEYLDSYEKLQLALSESSVAAARAGITKCLNWLWAVIVEPVMDRLGYEPITDGRSFETWPRVCWVPSGPLAVLPFHAAHLQDSTGRIKDGESTLSRVISSYSSTLRSLTHGRDFGRSGSAALSRLLAVAVPSTRFADLRPLAAAVEEVNTVEEILGQSVCTKLVDEDASRDGVLEKLRTHPAVHFAVHGGLNARTPDLSALLLSDRPLTVLDVADLDSSEPRFAFISACSTAAGSRMIPDESIHLAAAFRAAGYRHVIGTISPINDAWACEIARDFYRIMAEGGELVIDRAPYALHACTIKMREKYSGSPDAWAGYLHFGM